MAALLQSQDIAAIDAYITSVPVKTPAAQAAKEAWIQWNDGLGLYDRTFDRAALDHARNARLAFELANATTDAERATVLDRALHGMSSEEMQGQPDRRDGSGNYSERTPDSGLSRFVLWGVAAVGVAALCKRTLMR